MKSFDVETQTTPVSEYEFPKQSRQARRVSENNVVRLFRWRDVHGDVRLLPNYVKTAISNAGFEPVYVGGTTYSHAVIGLKQVQS
jgi:hypothetical protein